MLEGKPYCEKADVFSFGIVLYNLFHRCVVAASMTARCRRLGRAQNPCQSPCSMQQRACLSRLHCAHQL